MTRRLLFVLVPAALVAACSGLFLDNGNNWPCEYAKGPGLRDAACMAGDVCGVDDLCHRYVYEGPRFEGPASVPSFGAGSAQGKKLHPLILDEQLTFVTRELPFNSRHDAIAALTASGTVAGLTAQGQVGEAPVPSLANFTWAQAYEGPVLDGSMTRSQVLVRDTSGTLLGDLRPGDGARVPISAGAQVRFIDAPRSGALRESPWSMPLAWSAAEVGFVVPTPNPGVNPNNPRWALLPLTAFIPAAVHDFAGLTQPGQLWVAALGDETIQLAEVSRVDAGFQSLDAGVLALPTLSDGVTGGALRTDRDGRVLAAFRATRLPGRGEVTTVSTWQISAGANGPELSQPWPDCSPCRLGEEARFASVSVATGAPVVEVACAVPLLETFRMVRVVGSVALSPLEGCRTERFEPPFDISRINGARLLDGGLTPVTWAHQVGLLAGGKDGQLWFGDTLSGMQPLFLDRTPTDVAPFQIVDSNDPSRVLGSTLVALAGEQLSVLETNLLVAADAGQRVNGFRRFDQRLLGVSDDEHLMAFVHQTPGWGVTSSGDVVKTVVGLGSVTTRSGPRLVKASGEPILSSVGGEAFSVEGVLQAFFVAADDGVYFVRNPRRFLDAGVGAPVETLTPELTPEPSVPIRSLALERTPLGTDGVNRARGYLVTSRNVYAWQLAGSPARWSATQLLLGGGEPMEVWFDAPLSALGRVGFRDGQVFSLPGGYLLAEPLPNDGRVDGGLPAQVLDFENLGGWPVAYATNGLFIAGWDRNADGRLQNRFPDGGINRPMTWRRVTLPDGGEPWSSPSLRTRPGKLFTAIDPVLPGADAGLPDGGLQPHRLLLFLDDQVLQVAEHLRK